MKKAHKIVDAIISILFIAGISLMAIGCAIVDSDGNYIVATVVSFAGMFLSFTGLSLLKRGE